MTWRRLDLGAELVLNLREEEVDGGAASLLENVFVTEAGGHVPFPGAVLHAQLSTTGRVFLREHEGGLVAVTSTGRAFEVAPEDGTFRDRTTVPVGVVDRPTFADTGEGLVIAGGAELIRLLDETTVLSEEAPFSSLVCFAKGYVLAYDRDQQIFRYCEQDDPTSWPAQNTFDAESKPDRVVALLNTERNDILVGGSATTEFYRVVADPQLPFAPFADSGEGVAAPGTLCEAGGAVWCLNDDFRFVQVQLSAGRDVSGRVALTLERLSDLAQAWADECIVRGQSFILLSFPRALNRHGRRGVTLLFDYSGRRWSELTGPGRAGLPLHSLAKVGGRVFAGGDAGQVYRLDLDGASDLSRTFAYRSGFISASTILPGADEVFVSNMRLRVARPNNVRVEGRPATITVRSRWADDERWGIPIRYPIEGSGKPWIEFGTMGQGSAFQWEYTIDRAEGVDWAITRAEVEVEPLGN